MSFHLVEDTDPYVPRLNLNMPDDDYEPMIGTPRGMPKHRTIPRFPSTAVISSHHLLRSTSQEEDETDETDETEDEDEIIVPVRILCWVVCVCV